MQDGEFQTIPFPQDEDIVYVLKFRKPGASEMVPFYVGESRRGTRRIGDYASAQFAAATDFKAGMAVKFLKAQGCDVFVSYRRSDNRLQEEVSLIKELAVERRLLNQMSGYDYLSAQKSVEQLRVEKFMRELLQN